MAAPVPSLAPSFIRGASRTIPGSRLERAAAGIGFVLAAPVILLAATYAWVRSGQPPIVFHRRVGQYGATLWVPKLRTMWTQRQPLTYEWIQYLQTAPVPVDKTRPDPRVTSRFAAFCRRYSIDELPQLALVCSGKIRFVGPRPITQAELEQFYGEARHEVLSAVPGLTGLWQVMGRNRLTYAQRRRLDLFYVRHASARLNAWILLRTVKELLRPRAAW